LPVIGSRFALLMLVGVPMNIGFGSFSFSSSLPDPGCATSEVIARATNSVQVSARMVIEFLRIKG